VKKYFIAAVILLGTIVSYWGYVRDKDFVEHQKPANAMITGIIDVTGDKNVPKVKKPVKTVKVSYEFIVDGKLYNGWDIITPEDVKNGFPERAKKGMEIEILYDARDPADCKLKCKLKH
jgi:hypothetical protein